jgi:chromosome segregation ATPase
LEPRLTAGADAAADRNADVLARAADALETATSRAAQGMGQAIDEAVTKAGEESAKAISAAFAAFGSRFEQASEGLVDTLRSTAGRMESLASSIERSAQASDSYATKLAEAGSAAEGIATTLNKAANDLQTAAVPIRSATETIGLAVTRVENSLSRHTEVANQNQTAIALVADRLSQTSESATKAWEDYRNRFEDVDKSLAASLDQIKNASGEHAAHLNEQVGRIDNALAGAVDKLSASLEPLTELADQIEDLIGRMQGQV